jgi:antitoxin (DNA-binding transcriptional repressor) of toxin-antitoxin stability system
MNVSIEQAQLSLKDLIDKTSRGEPVVITRDENPVAELKAINAVKPSPVFGSCKGLLIIQAEDDEHLADFAEYMK